MKDWTKLQKISFILMVVSIISLIVLTSTIKTNEKHYPIEVRCHWETSQSSYYPTMEADSVKGDTIWKDGNKIVNKNIKNVEFK
jgi:hypothetical protein